ncbi:hypothetical protein ACJIZ3_008337 [Penstemon smallii]|uniref:Maternal effect embryo arrest 22 n=1 Tax=Penstemon smallii TaxID=265156 RepID=A0ABD3T9F7_9LAMI
MAEDVQVTQDKPCCAELKKEYTKLDRKYKKANEIKKQFRDCTTLIQKKYDLIEKENGSLKQENEDLKAEVSRWKDEKEKESCIRVDLEDEVSALKDEIQLLKQNGSSASQEADGQLQDHLVAAEKEIQQLKELLVKERGRADLERKNAETERKKASDTLKKVEIEKSKASEAQRLVNIEKKKAEESRILWENLKKETDEVKSMLASERSKSEAAGKKLEAEKQKTIRDKKKTDLAVARAKEQQELAEKNLKKAEEYKQMWEKLQMETDSVKSMLTSYKSKSEAADKKVEAEKQKTAIEKKRADLAVAQAEEQRKLAETNMKKVRFEKDRGDDLNRKLEEERTRARRLEEELRERSCSMNLVETHADPSSNGKMAVLASDVCAGVVRSDAQMSQWMEKMLLEKEHNFIREKNRADSEAKKAKKQGKVAEEHKRMAIEEKHRADQLSKELEDYKLSFEELRKEVQELVSNRINSDSLLRENSIIRETDTVKLLKKQLKLEKMLVKHAKKATKLEAIRNNMLHEELFHLKQQFKRFQQRLDLLDDSFLDDGETTHELKKLSTFASENFYLDGDHRQQTSGIGSRLDPPCRGSELKILRSSAINSSSASFSDQPLVGSQERGTSSDMTSAKQGEDNTNLGPTKLRLSDMRKMRYNENAVDKAENSIRSSSSGKKTTVGCRDKRRVLDAVESVESFYSKGQKLHQRVSGKLSQLHGLLNGQKDKPAKENLQKNSGDEHVRPFKRRKTSCDGTIVIHPLHESGEPKSMVDANIDDSDACMRVSPPGFDVVTSDQPLKDRMDNTLMHDYMKLLDLDNSADEESYRRAIATPLSPMLPEIEFHGDEALEVDNPDMLVDKSFQEGLSFVKDNVFPISSFDIFDMEKNPTNVVPSVVVSSKMTEEDTDDFSKNTDCMQAGDAQLQQIQVPDEQFESSVISGSEHKETEILSEKRLASTCGLLKYFVISFDNKDDNSILRVLQTISGCMLQCSLLQSADVFLRNLLLTLSKAEDLSAKERVCVFFSVILHEISEAGMKNLTNIMSNDLVQSLDSFTLHLSSALSALVLRRTFMESCDLFELLAFIEDFLLQRKVLVCVDVSAGSPVVCSPKINLVLNGNAITLSEQAASAHLLVAGASLLASLCLAIDHIGFVCEISCNIFAAEIFDPDMVLPVLHAFAHTCGSKYFTLPQYTLTMTVIKSLVMFLEKQTLCNHSTSSSPSQVKTPSKSWSCSTNCPFSEDAAPMEDLVLLLSEKLQQYGQSVSWPHDSLELVKSLVPRVSHEDTGLRDDNLLSFVDILSLVETIASFMGWDWTKDNIIGQFCKLLESCLMEGFSAAIIILLGQLGRLGVNASGYEDIGIKKLRGWLSEFLCQSNFSKLSLPVQFSIVTALLSITPIKFEEIVENQVETPLVMSDSIHPNFIRKWFALLSHEQQSFFKLHLAGSETNFRKL